MKRFISLLLALTLVVGMVCVFSACGNDKDGEKETSNSVETEAPDNSDTEGSKEEDKTTAKPEAIKEGTLTLSDLVTIELKDGWYTKEGIDTTWNSVKLVNDSITEFLANVKVSVGSIYGDKNAEYWASAIKDNYGGKGAITTEEINGLTFYHLSGVVDGDTQNIYYADIDDSHYLNVNIMFMPADEGVPVFDLLTINK